MVATWCGWLLRLERERLGLQAVALARSLGVSGRQVYAWETCREVPRYAMQQRLAEAVGVPLRQLYATAPEVERLRVAWKAYKAQETRKPWYCLLSGIDCAWVQLRHGHEPPRPWVAATCHPEREARLRSGGECWGCYQRRRRLTLAGVSVGCQQEVDP